MLLYVLFVNEGLVRFLAVARLDKGEVLKQNYTQKRMVLSVGVCRACHFYSR